MASQRSESSSPSSGDHYNSETAGASCWSPRTWQTATLDYVQKTLNLGALLLATQDGQNENARDKRPGLMVPHFAGCYTTPRRNPPKPHRPDLFAPRYASMLCFCQPRTPHLTASLRAQPAQASVPPPYLIFGASDQLGAMPQGMHTGIESPRQEAGLLGLPSARSSATLQRSRLKPQQPDLFAPRHASRLHICQPRAPNFTSSAPRAASACLGTVSHLLFGASDQLGIMPQGRHTGIETG